MNCQRQEGWPLRGKLESTYNYHAVEESLLSTPSLTNKSLAKEIKTTMRDHFTPIRMAIIKKKTHKNQKTTSVGEAVEKLEPLCTADRNVQWCHHYRKW